MKKTKEVVVSLVMAALFFLVVVKLVEGKVFDTVKASDEIEHRGERI